MKNSILWTLFVTFSLIVISGCATLPVGDNAQDKRAAIQQMKADTLQDLYAIHPQAKSRIQNAEGYAVFSNVSVNILYVSGGAGWGIAHDNKANAEYYMKMISGGVGPGVGVNDFRGIFVFKSRQAFTDFKDKGWVAGVVGDVVAKSGAKGGGAGAAVSIAPDIDLYQLTKNGLALQVTLQGSKYYMDKELNQL